MVLGSSHPAIQIGRRITSIQHGTETFIVGSCSSSHYRKSRGKVDLLRRMSGNIACLANDLIVFRRDGRLVSLLGDNAIRDDTSRARLEMILCRNRPSGSAI